MFTAEKLQQALAILQLSSSAFCIAYSGGQDSHVLLHAMAKLRENNNHFTLRAIHVHHGLSLHADEWALHCQSICDQLSIPLTIKKINLTLVAGDSVEAKARQLRYQVFTEMLKKEENLLSAHHLDDQTETFLLQLLRGAGVKGLSAMPNKKILGAGFLLRPLLNFSHHELAQYAQEHALRWIEDESNLSLRFSRNFLRHEILPSLRQRWPQALTMISRSAQHCAEADELLNVLADEDLSRCLKNQDFSTSQPLSVQELLSLSRARQKNVLRRWIVKQGHLTPQTKHLEQILKNVVGASVKATPLFCWETGEIRRYQNFLYLLPKENRSENSAIITWNLKQALELPYNLGTLNAEYKKGEGIISHLDSSKFTVRFRQGGEKIRLTTRKVTHSLKQLMQDWQIPPWQRDCVPLLFYEEKLAAVVGYGVSEEYAAKHEESGIVLLHRVP